MECSKCHSNNVNIDESRAEIICEDCGMIEEMIDGRKSTEFEEIENGRVVPVGSFVFTGQFASKQATIKKASGRIYNLCSNLSLTKCTAEYAVNIFKNALSDGMTRGRNALVTIGASVYLAARAKQQSLMLLDVSDKIGVNVYTLGKFYKELKEKNGQNIPDIDPALFIRRFALNLELGDQMEAVMTTALKILQRMKKDWLSTGRRPNNITAAALLIASRIHRFDRDCSDLAKISGVSKHTTNKRLEEWAQTSTSDLTLAQFGKIEYEDEFDPPSFTNQKSEQNDISEISKEDFESIMTRVHCMRKQLKGENINEMDRYKCLVDSIESGTCDIEGLIGSLEADDDDNEYIEYDGRIQLLSECSGMVGKLRHLKKKETEDNVIETREVELPLCLDRDCDQSEGIWPPLGEDIVNEEINDEELERIYICSNNESIKKMKWWLKSNKDFYKKKKISEEKRLLIKKQEEEKGKKKTSKGRRKKRDYLFTVDKEELLRDISKKSNDSYQSPPLKKQYLTKEEESEGQEEDFMEINHYKHEKNEDGVYGEGDI